MRSGRFPDRAQNLGAWYPEPVLKESKADGKGSFQFLSSIRPINKKFQKFTFLFKIQLLKPIVFYVLSPKERFFFFILKLLPCWHITSSPTRSLKIQHLAGISSNSSHGLSPHHPDLRFVWSTSCHFLAHRWRASCSQKLELRGETVQVSDLSWMKMQLQCTPWDHIQHTSNDGCLLPSKTETVQIWMDKRSFS